MRVSKIEAEKIIRTTADKAITKDNIMSYLNLVANNPAMSVLNQALIYSQMPEGKCFCGGKAWGNIGCTVRADERPISLIIPHIDTEDYDYEYLPVKAFAESQVEGDTKQPDLSDISFVDAVIEITGMTPISVDPAKINGCKSKFDKDNNEILISKNIDIKTDAGKKEYNKAIVNAYITSTLESYGVKNATLMDKAVLYVLCTRYGFDAKNINPILFRKLNDMSTDERVKFMFNLQFFVSGMVQDFEGYYLQFDEVILLGDLMTVTEPDELIDVLVKSEQGIASDNLKYIIRILREKLTRTERQDIMELISLRESHQLCTYPHRLLQLDKTDYLREARTILNNVK